MNFLDINRTPNESFANHVIPTNNNNRNKQSSNENEYFTFKEESLSSDKNHNNNETNIYNVNNNNYYCENKFYLEIPIDHKEQIFFCNRIETYSFRGCCPNEENAEHKQQQTNHKSDRVSPNISRIKRISPCKENESDIKHIADINDIHELYIDVSKFGGAHLKIDEIYKTLNEFKNNGIKIHRKGGAEAYKGA